MRNLLYKYKKYAGGVMLLTAVAVLAGCTERSLSEWPADGPLKINLVWPDGQSVAGAQLWFYGSDGSLHHVATCAANGHECRVPADTYTILAANSDCSNADCHNHDSWQECCMKAAQEEGDGTLQHVGKVFCTGTNEVTVGHGNLPVEITLYPKNVVKLLHFKIDPDYIEKIADMELSMSGVVPSVKLIDGSDAGEATGTVSASAQSGADGLYFADMSVFGWRGENIVTVAINCSDGSIVTTVPQDISRQLA